jgi:hypothetical protein
VEAEGPHGGGELQTKPLHTDAAAARKQCYQDLSQYGDILLEIASNSELFTIMSGIRMDLINEAVDYEREAVSRAFAGPACQVCSFAMPTIMNYFIPVSPALKRHGSAIRFPYLEEVP